MDLLLTNAGVEELFCFHETLVDRAEVGLKLRLDRLLGLAGGAQGHRAPIEGERIGVAGIDQRIVALHGIGIVVAGEGLVAQRGAG